MSARGGAEGGRGRIEVGVRRAVDLDLDAPLPPSEPELLARIAAEIRELGPMTFARFMELALYDPDAGYYSGRAEADAARGPGRGGDFVTAPEGHPIFGWAIARDLEDAWGRLGRPNRFVVREHGAGSGALAFGILDGLRRSGSPLAEVIRYQAIEVGRSALDELDARLDAAGLARALEAPDGTPAAGAVIANELLDALPVHRVAGSDEGLLERFVTLDPAGELATTLATPSTTALRERLDAEAIDLHPGQEAEICLALDGWLEAALAPLERGLVVLIDYGRPASELYAPDRGPTLRAYHRHRVHADPLVGVGRQDLTTHVDLTAVERVAERLGLEPLGRTRQAAYLASLGIGDLLVGLQSEPGVDLERYLTAKSAVIRMLDPRATGGFAVLRFGRGLPREAGRPR